MYYLTKRINLSTFENCDINYLDFIYISSHGENI